MANHTSDDFTADHLLDRGRFEQGVILIFLAVSAYVAVSCVSELAARQQFADLLEREINSQSSMLVSSERLSAGAGSARSADRAAAGAALRYRSCPAG